MESRPRMTVTVCTRNRPAALENCLRSIDSLHPAPDATVVVDQSDPEAAAAVRCLCTPPRRYVPSEPKGLGHARQVALDACETELLLFTDDDCLVRQGWAGALAAVFAVHPRAGIAVGAVRPHPSHPLPEGVPGWVTEWGDGRTRVFEEPTDPAEIGGGLNMAFRTSALREAGGFDPRFGPGGPFRGAEDADAVHRVLRAGWTAVYTPEAVVSHTPPRDRSEHEARERADAFGFGAWAAVRWREGDRLPRRWWSAAIRRALSRAVRRAPIQRPRSTAQRFRIAWELWRGWRAGRRFPDRSGP